MHSNYDHGGLTGPSNAAARPGKMDGVALIEEDTSTCPTPMWMTRSHRGTGEMNDFPKPCGRASCPTCGPALGRRQTAWFASVFEGRSGLYLNAFTVDPAHVRALGSPWLVRQYLASAFGTRLRPRLQRRSKPRGQPLVYLAAAERHKSGTPHLHVLLDGELEEEEIRSQAFAAGLGAVMSVRPVESDRDSVRVAVGYVLKDAFGPQRLAGERSVWTSQGIGYYGPVAMEERRQHVRLTRGIDDEGEYAVEPARVRVAPQRRPKGLSSADRERIAKANATRRQSRYLERSTDGRRGVRHIYSGVPGGYRADAVVIVRTGDDEHVIVAAEDIDAEAARHHLAGLLFGN